MADTLSTHVAETPATLTTADGVALSALWIEPARPSSVVVLHGATGVPRDYYRRFATWLAAERGAATLLYAYRDMEEGGTPPRRSRATMGDWLTLDQPAALAAAFVRHPGLPVDVVGHSLGAMGLAFHPGAERVRKLVAVASGPAHWTRHPLHYTPLVIAFWFLVGPLATALFRYTPGRLIGLGADLPAGVFWQWRRWCVNRRFHEAEWGRALPVPDLNRFEGALKLVASVDDVMIPPPVVADLKRFYPAAQVSSTLLDPAEIGGGGIGHLRMFSPRHRALWPKLAP